MCSTCGSEEYFLRKRAKKNKQRTPEQLEQDVVNEETDFLEKLRECKKNVSQHAFMNQIDGKTQKGIVLETELQDLRHIQFALKKWGWYERSLFELKCYGSPIVVSDTDEIKPKEPPQSWLLSITNRVFWTINDNLNKQLHPSDKLYTAPHIPPSDTMAAQGAAILCDYFKTFSVGERELWLKFVNQPPMDVWSLEYAMLFVAARMLSAGVCCDTMAAWEEVMADTNAQFKDLADWRRI
jgi:hypothetical protein